MCRRTLLILFICLVRFGVLAQSADFSFQHITVDEGLSQSTVFSIAQDKDGFIWMGTRDGLNRYDGRVIKNYFNNTGNPRSLRDNSVYCIKRDSSQRLLIGTANGILLYHPETDDFTTISLSADAATEPTVTAIQDDHRGNMWVGTRTGLYIVNKGEPRGTAIDIPGSDATRDIRSIYIGNDTIWAGTSEGLLRISGPAGKRETKLFVIPNSPSTNNNWVNEVATGENGRLLIGSQNSGVLTFDPSSQTFSKVHWITNTESGSETVRKIIDYNNQWWIGTMNGIFVVDRQAKTTVHVRNVVDNPTSLTDNSVRCMFADRDGTMWIGTFHGGANTYNKLSRQFGSIPKLEGLNFKIASCLATDLNGNLWIGSEGNGLFYFDPSHRITRNYKHSQDNPASLSHNNVKSLLLDEGKGLWIGTIKGLNYFNFKTRSISRFTYRSEIKNGLPDDMIYALLRDTDGSIWIGTYRGGLSHFDPLSKTFTNYPASQNENRSINSNGITCLATDRKGNLLIGTTSGINIKLSGTDTFKQFSDSGSLRSDYVLCLYQDTHDRLWAGTRGNGLHLLRPTESTFHKIEHESFVTRNTVYGIQEDESGNLWISTDNGLAKLDPTDLTVHNYDRGDGLVCQEFNFNSYCRQANGIMYFGGYNGIVSFHPGSIARNTTPPTLRFTKLKIFNKDIAVGLDDNSLPGDINYLSQIDFNYHQNVFSIEFAVLNYINPAKNHFAYRLEGFEDDWNFTAAPVATYMNLSPGQYRLLVKGANNDGIWSEKPLALALTIEAPPWRTWWAYTIYGALILALLLTWVRFKHNRLRLEHALEIEHLEIKKQEEIHQAKLSFFANIIHELRTPLTLIITPIEKLLAQYPADNFIKKELALVQKNTNRLQRLMSQLLDFHKQETGNVKIQVREDNIVDFLEEIHLSFKEYAESRKVNLAFTNGESDIRLWFDREEMSKVFSNLLINAFKFTPGGGTVAINVARQVLDENRFVVNIDINDTGLGISKANLEKIFHRFYQAEQTRKNEAGVGIGLALAKGIIDLHHGTISVESEEATTTATGFTRFRITLLSGGAHFTADQFAPPIASNPIAEPMVLPQTDDHTVDEEEVSAPDVNRQLILVVEDDADVRNYTTDLLRKSYRVIEAADGRTGLEIAFDRLPDLIISDVVMPGMNGIELVKTVKADVRTSHIPVVLLTARAALNYQIEGIDTGADDYLTKPFHAQLLELKIKNHLLIRERLREKYSRFVTLQPEVGEIQSPDDKFLQRLMHIIDENVTQADFNVGKLVREIGMSRPVLFRKIKMLTGMSVIDLIRDVRLKKAAMLLQQKNMTVAEVAFTVGFTDPKYFSKTFRTHFGKSPTQFIDDK